MPDEAAYPTRWEADVALADGGDGAHPPAAHDAELVEAFHNRQSRESIYFRYFSPMPRLSPAARRLTKVDYLDHLSLVAMLGGEIIGMARLRPLDRPGRGRGGRLHHRRRPPRRRPRHRPASSGWWWPLARSASGASPPRSPEQRSMLAVFHQVGFEATSLVRRRRHRGEAGPEATPEPWLRVDERAQRAEARSVERPISPTSVASSGRRAGRLGHEVFRNLLARLHGARYPVNPQGRSRRQRAELPTVLDIPEVDLVIAVPAHEVLPSSTSAPASGCRRWSS
jgi:hypothetical protein